MVKNVLGTELQPCCFSPLTGWLRDGFCNTEAADTGSHTICVKVDKDFLEYSKSIGNDLTTPNEFFGFSGLKDGDYWCLCASRWKQARDDGHAPKIRIQACHEKCLEIVSLEELHPYIIEETLEEKLLKETL